MNCRSVSKFEKSFFSQYFEPISVTVLPREELVYPEQKNLKPKKMWIKDTSVFAKYQQDTSTILEKAMDADWNNSKIPRFVKDPVDRKKLFVRIHENKKKNDFLFIIFSEILIDLFFV